MRRRRWPKQPRTVRRPPPVRPVDPLAAEIAAAEQAWRDARFDRTWWELRDPARSAAAGERERAAEAHRVELVAEHRARTEASSRARAREGFDDDRDPLDTWSRGGTGR